MEDQLIEVWRKEFESNFIDGRLDRFDKSGNYVNDYRQTLWQGFLMAKRNMPVVELPDHIVLTLALGDTVPLLTKSDVIDALKSAGIQYRIKGE